MSSQRWKRKHFSPRKHIFPLKIPQLETYHFLLNKKRVCRRGGGGGKERGKNLHGSYASSLGARPSLRPRAPGHFPSHPPRSRGGKLREAGSGHVNQPGPPVSRRHLPSPPPQKIKAEKERKKKVTNLGTSLRGLRLRPREAARPRPDAPGSSRRPGNRLSPGPRSASAALWLPARVGAAPAPHSVKLAARHPPARAKVAQIAPQLANTHRPQQDPGLRKF